MEQLKLLWDKEIFSNIKLTRIIFNAIWGPADLIEGTCNTLCRQMEKKLFINNCSYSLNSKNNLLSFKDTHLHIYDTQCETDDGKGTCI